MTSILGVSSCLIALVCHFEQLASEEVVTLELRWQEPVLPACRSLLLFSGPNAPVSALVCSATRSATTGVRIRLQVFELERHRKALATAQEYPLSEEHVSAEYVSLAPTLDDNADGYPEFVMIAKEAWPGKATTRRSWIVSGRSLQLVRSLADPEEAVSPSTATQCSCGQNAVIALGRPVCELGVGQVTLHDVTNGQVVRSIRPPFGYFFGSAVVCVSSTDMKRPQFLAVGAPSASRLGSDLSGALLAYDLTSAIDEPVWTVFGEGPGQGFGAGYAGVVIGVQDVDSDTYTDLAVPVFDVNNLYHDKGIDLISGRTGERISCIPPPGGLERFGSNLVADLSGRFIAVAGSRGSTAFIFVYEVNPRGGLLRAQVKDEFYLEADIQGLGLSVVNGNPTVAVLTGIESDIPDVAQPTELRVYGLADSLDEKRR